MFKPNLTNIKLIPAGESRQSTLTVKINDGTNDIVTKKFTITIHNISKPVFSIEAVTSTIDEGGTMQFKVTSDINPGTSTYEKVAYTPVNTEEDYLASTLDGESQEVDLTFTSETVNGEVVWTDTFDVQLDLIDGDSTAPGKVTVTLDPVDITNPAEVVYVVAPTPNNSAVVTVNDATGITLTIADAPDTYATKPAQFVLTASPQPYRPIRVKYTPDDEPGKSFLYAPTQLQGSGFERISDPITFGPSEADPSVFVGILSIPTKRYGNVNDTGKIEVWLQTNPMDTIYQLTGTAADNTKEVMVTNIDIPEISIKATETSTDEGTAATITVTSTIHPANDRNVEIKFTPTNEVGTYLKSTSAAEDSGKTRTATLDFTTTNSTTTATFNLDTRDPDANVTAPGRIALVINPPGPTDLYTIGTDTGDDRINIIVYDSIKPELTLDTNAPDVNGGNNAEFTIKSTRVPLTPIEIKYTATETGTSFLAPNGYSPTDTRTGRVTFSGVAPNITGTLEIPTQIDPDAPSGTITIVLQDNARIYTIKTAANEKSAKVIVRDPSYVRVQLSTPENPTVYDQNSAVIGITSTSATYNSMSAITEALYADRNDLTAQATINVNGTESTSNTVTGHGTVQTNYGNWILNNDWTDDSGAGTATARFEPNSTIINNITPGTIVKLELNLTVPTNVTSKTTITIAHNTTVLWSSGGSTVREVPDTTASSTRNDATITTFHTPVSALSFKAKLFDNTASGSEVTFSREEKVSDPGWDGQEWVADVTYGEWVIGKQTTCQTNATCYDVRFLPDTTAIDAVSGKVVKVDLEVSIPQSGQTEPLELDTLSYLIDGNSASIAADPGSINSLFVGGSTATLDDVAATATIAKNTGYTLRIGISETQDNQGTNTPRTGTKGATVNDDAGFDSFQYGTNLSYGSWYFAEDNTSTPTVSVVDTGFHTIARKVLFRPNTTAISDLSVGSTRRSTLTLEVLDGAVAVATTSFVVTMQRVNKPVYTLTASTTTINEGTAARLTISVDQNPNTNPVTLQYTPTNVTGTFLTGTSGSPRDADNLSWTQTQGQDRWTAPLAISLKNPDNEYTGDGSLTVALVGVASNEQYIVDTTAITFTIIDVNVPEISIAKPSNIKPGQTMNFPLTSSVRSNVQFQLRYTPTNTIGNFLNSTIADKVQTLPVRFNTQRRATLPITTLNQNLNSGRITVQLQDDNNATRDTYTVSASNGSATGGIVKNHIALEMNGSTTRTILITSTSTTYSNINARLSTLWSERNNFARRLIVSKSVDGGPFTETEVVPPRGNLLTQYGSFPFNVTEYNSSYGKWKLPAISQNDNFGVGFQTAGVRFEPNNSAINNIPMGTVVKIELRMRLSGPNNPAIRGLRGTTTIFIQHEILGSASWTSNSNTALTESANSADFSTPKEATINSKYDTDSGLSFKSKLYDDVGATATEMTLVEEERVGNWNGMEWTAPTTYGRWIVGNRQTCETNRHCYNVRFVPESDEISDIIDKNIKLELEVIITESGQSPETVETLTYTITGDKLEIALADGSSTVIKASDGRSAYSDIGATTTAFKSKTDRFQIATNETTTNSQTPTRTGTDINTGITTPFQSKTYGNNLTYGAWYFEATDQTTTDYQADTTFHTATRRILFRPNVTNINELEIGDVRYSSIKVTTKRGSTDISTQTFTVAIFRTNKPTFSIEAVNSTANEGGSAMFRVSSDIDPGDILYTVYYKPVNDTGTDASGNEYGNFLHADDPVSGETREAGLRFDESQSGDMWTQTFAVRMKAVDEDDEAHGAVTVTLNSFTLDSTSPYTTAIAPKDSATVTVYDQTFPIISIENAPTIASAGVAKFPLTSDIEPLGSSLGIRFIPSNVSPGDYLNTTDTTFSNAGVSGDIRIANPRVEFVESDDGLSYVGTLSVQSKLDNNTDGGSISVELLDGPTTSGAEEYKINTDAVNTRTVEIADYPKVTISINDRTKTVTEGGDVEIVFVATEDPVRELPIKFTPTETGTTYLMNDDDGNGTGATRTTAPLEFRQDPNFNNKFVANTTISTTGNNIHGPHGTITVSLDATEADDVYNAATTDNSMIITVNNDEIPTITIADAPAIKGGQNAEFPITVTGHRPNGDSLDIKYNITETGTNFLSPTITNPTEQKMTPITFTVGASPFTSGTGTLTIPTHDDPNGNNGTISITLAEDNLNYTLSATNSERTKSVMVTDPSYAEINSFNSDDFDNSNFHNTTHMRLEVGNLTPDKYWTSQVATLYIKDTPADYKIGNITRIPFVDRDSFDVVARSYRNDSTIHEDSDTLSNNGGTLTTSIGKWKLNGKPNNNPHARANSEFIISRNDINNIPLGSTARIEVELTVPTEVSSKAILHLVHNTSPSWNGKFSASLIENKDTGDFSVNKEATITTYHDTVSEISFNLKLYDGSSTPNEEALTREELVSGWSGMEWTASNNYGRWIVGTKSTCPDSANCFNVRFEPNATNIDAIADKTVQLELETVITGSAPETKALTYTIVDESLELALRSR